MKLSKFVLLGLFFFSFAFVANAQKFPKLDKSPLDIAYLPPNYAHDKSDGERAIVKVIYSRPYKNDRVIFGKKVPYGKVWRTGANEATEIKVYKDIKINGKELKAGTYSLFTIPEKDQWTIIISSDLDDWGAYSYKEKNDVLRTVVPVSTLKNVVENFTIKFEKGDKGQAIMQFAWDTTLVEVPISL